MRTSILFGVSLAATLLISGCSNSAAPEAGTPEPQETKEIGASLNKKIEVDLNEVPEAVFDAARAARPGITFTEAEREEKNGLVYYDIGGVDADGSEIELDIVQNGDGWRVVEIQRDITFEETPAIVRSALEESVPGLSPARIIESDQGDGVIIYEFYSVSDNGEEQKHEVRYDGETAEVLTEEWGH